MRIVLGTIFGFLLGIGVAGLLFSYAKVAVGTDAPAVIALVGAGVGLLIGLAAWLRRRSASTSRAAPEA